MKHDWHDILSSNKGKADVQIQWCYLTGFVRAKRSNDIYWETSEKATSAKYAEVIGNQLLGRR